MKLGNISMFTLGGENHRTEIQCDQGFCHNVLRDIDIWEWGITPRGANQDALIDKVNKIAKNVINTDGGEAIDTEQKSLEAIRKYYRESGTEAELDGVMSQCGWCHAHIARLEIEGATPLESRAELKKFLKRELEINKKESDKMETPENTENIEPAAPETPEIDTPEPIVETPTRPEDVDVTSDIDVLKSDVNDLKVSIDDIKKLLF